MLIIFLFVNFWLGNQFAVRADDATVFCDDVYGKYIALSGNMMLGNYEYPIMDTVPPGSSPSSIYGFPKMLLPCYSMNANGNYKNQLYDIFEYGNFGPETCGRSCAHFVETFYWTCGDRRPAPDWVVGSIGGVTRKINCSDWDIPLTDKGKQDVSLGNESFGLQNGTMKLELKF
ncbi:unnamed protein product [Caenorhabditis angaria]|uniref:Uncharacterized protein n=1 Tax=Caenorhabditis angaria TaxID=860376 RepID=A0A9P1MWN0_9PELO|nr:unnamed protein product [Caenorhabditis angaria]